MSGFLNFFFEMRRSMSGFGGGVCQVLEEEYVRFRRRSMSGFGGGVCQVT